MIHSYKGWPVCILSRRRLGTLLAQLGGARMESTSWWNNLFRVSNYEDVGADVRVACATSSNATTAAAWGLHPLYQGAFVRATCLYQEKNCEAWNAVGK
jgi:hypothetical protein